ncbi:MAG TPA: CHC2 zinc finger domain-containing protein [Chloroflexota bacterium]|nr:CHC2 zinc finger domain-containing protein [Chloroflexota bacterium]
MLAATADGGSVRRGAAPARFDADAIQRIKRGHRLADVVRSRGVDLRPSGALLVGACPFHDDQEPSFTVYESDDHWHCFGCAAHGDVIDFVMRFEHLSFPEACARLGGVRTSQPQTAPGGPTTVPAPAASIGPKSSRSRATRELRWDRLTLDEQVVLNTAAAVYRHCLWREPRALAYLHDRGLSDDVIRECGIGYADGRTLEAYLRRRTGLRVAQELCLLRRPAHAAARAEGHRAIEDDSHLRERFAERIVIPEIRGGNVIWMIGRAFDGPSPGGPGGRGRAAAPPKYIALPGERPILGLERAARQREVLICEGVFDYLTAVAWRLPACSPCGTHIPVDRLGFLARARHVFGVFDGDEAGRAAAARFAAELGARWREIALPDGTDLNDLGRAPGGAAHFFRLLAAARRAETPEPPAQVPAVPPAGSGTAGQPEPQPEHDRSEETRDEHRD